MKGSTEYRGTAQRGIARRRMLGAILLMLTLLAVDMATGATAQSGAGIETPLTTAVAASCTSTCPFPAGWTELTTTIDWKNYTLPFFPGTRYFAAGFDTPVITANNPSRVLTAYYLNSSGELVAFDLKSGQTTTLHAWNTSLENPSSPSLLLGYQAPNGTVTDLYEIGNDSSVDHTYWVDWYSLTNGSYYHVNTTIRRWGVGPKSNEGPGEFSDNGWIYVINQTATSAVFFNIFSGEKITLALPGLPAWNSPALVPTANQVIEDVNDPVNETVDVLAVGLNTTGPAQASYALFRSQRTPLARSPDTNNMPYVYSPSGETTAVYGIGAGDGYHVLSLTLNRSLTSDRVDSVIATNGPGTTDTGATAEYSASLWSLNGEPGNLLEYQAPFMDPVNHTVIYASNSKWFNHEIYATRFAFGTGPWINSWQFLGMSGFENAVLTERNGKAASCGSTCRLIVYWLPAYTSEFVAARDPAAPKNLTESSDTSDSAVWNWTQSSSVGIVNDTVELFAGGTCEGPAASYGTEGPSNSTRITGLAPGTTYSAEVWAWNSRGESPASKCVAGHTSSEAPAPPNPRSAEGTASVGSPRGGSGSSPMKAAHLGRTNRITDPRPVALPRPRGDLLIGRQFGP